MSELLSRFAVLLKSVSESEIRADPTLQGRLSLNRAHELSIFYAPFEYIQRSARIAIVGITPGLQKAANSLSEARRHLLGGADDVEVLRSAKVHASFSGPMRANLVEMLDHIGLHSVLKISSTAEIWGRKASLVHFTSALRYPVLFRGKNYSGQPSMISTPLLANCLNEYLREEAMALPDAIWVPLGPAATQGLAWLANKGVIAPERILVGLPHPSGANAERIAYFVRRKPREALSSKTNPAELDRVRDMLLAQVSRLMAP